MNPDTDKSTLAPRLRYPSHWTERKHRQEKISVLTAYDAAFASLLCQSQIDALLIGDSLGMVVQGHSSTLPVTLKDMIYHCRMVRRGAPDLFLIGDMPFASYQTSVEQALSNAMRLVQKGKVDAIKVEGAQPQLLKAIEKLVAYGIPVMGHVGLTPQSYRNTDGFRMQGRDAYAAEKINSEALSLQAVGCFAIVLELVVAGLAQKITRDLKIATIGIGSGPHTDGQVLVLHDLLGLNPNFHPRHARSYANLGQEIIAAADRYHLDVQRGQFPDKQNSFD